MTTLPEALQIVLEHIKTLETEEKPLLGSVGQVLAEDIYSDYDLPMLDASGPDGYAVRSADIAGAGINTPVTLDIVEVVRAGILPMKRVTPGKAIRIMTGSVLPEGADCVVRFEDTDEPENKSGPNAANPTKVKIFAAQQTGTNMNKAGNNLKKGRLVLSAGRVIGPIQLSVLTTIGKTSIKVHRRPIIAVISTGDELIESGQALVPGKSYDCNTETIQALISHYGGISKIIGIAQDTTDSLLAAIRKSLIADLIITSGGVSKGDYDLIRLVLETTGKVFLNRINVGPGAAFAFGEYHIQGKGKTGAIPVFALTGPPAGCMINFETLVRPAILKMLGFSKIDHPVVVAVTEDAVPGKRAMAFVNWTKLSFVNNQYRVRFHTASDNCHMVSMTNANSLTIIPVDEEVSAGDKVQVLPLDWCRDAGL